MNHDGSQSTSSPALGSSFHQSSQNEDMVYFNKEGLDHYIDHNLFGAGNGQKNNSSLGGHYQAGPNNAFLPVGSNLGVNPQLMQPNDNQFSNQASNQPGFNQSVGQAVQQPAFSQGVNQIAFGQAFNQYSGNNDSNQFSGGGEPMSIMPAGANEASNPEAVQAALPVIAGYAYEGRTFS